MSKVSLSEAARLTGKSRVTIHRHIEKGKLTKEIDGTGNPVVDIAELERVYGTLKHPDLSQDVAEQQPETVNGNSLIQVELEMLREQIVTLEAERARERGQQDETIQDLRRERDRLLKLVEDQTATVKLLTDQRAKEQEAPAVTIDPAPQKPAGGIWGRVRYVLTGT